MNYTNCRNCAVFRPVPLTGDGARWHKKNLSWWAPLPSQVSRRSKNSRPDLLANFTAAAAVAIERWRPVVDLEFKRVTHRREADFVLTLGRIDGRNRTLAYAYLPSDEYDSPLEGDVVFDEVDFARLSHEGRIEVLAHEIGHSLGLEHADTTSRALMAPRYNGERMAGMLRPHDIQRIQRRYGAREW